MGSFEDGKVTLTAGQLFRFDLSPELGTAERVCLPHPEILTTLAAGDVLLLDDGKLSMRVRQSTMARDAASGALSGQVVCEVVLGGSLSNSKGVNTPSVVLPISPLTAKDRE